jgi:hypothetical protein
VVLVLNSGSFHGNVMLSGAALFAASASNDLLGIVITEHFYYVLCESLLDLTVPWHRLSNLGCRVLIPVMPVTMTDENTTHAFKSFYQFAPFHDISRSAILRTFGIKPLVKSL